LLIFNNHKKLISSNKFSPITACSKGLVGDRLVLAEDGFEIADDEDLLENIGNQLMILSGDQEWLDPKQQLQQQPFHQQQNQQVLEQQIITVEDLNEVPSFSGDFKTGTVFQTLETVSIVDERIPDADETPTGNEWDKLLGTPVPISASDAEKFSKFELPWNKLNSDLMKDITNQKRLSHMELSEVSRVFVGELRTIHPRVPKPVLVRVSRGAANLYPKSFLQTDEDGYMHGKRPNLFLQKMVRHRDHCNREYKKKTHTIQTVHKEPKEIRKSSKIADSVVNYQPNIVGQETELEEKKVWLQQIHGTPQGSEQGAEISAVFIATYGLQRKEINKTPSAVEVFNAWPHLKDFEYFKVHFQMLTGKKLENFVFFFEKYKGALITHLQASKMVRIKKETALIRDLHSDVQALRLLAAYFKESYTDLVVNFEV
jgi:hypothetical protein